ncbi:hypothetical protein [Raineyella antarctica]|nr:hypothetical protein [Raineyella antarctica]
MYSRETTTQGSYDPAALVEQINNTILPGISHRNGFRGINVSGDPSTGTAWILTNWDTVEDLVASRQDADQLRRQATQALGGTVLGVREWDLPVVHVSDRPPTPGLPINVNRHFYDPTQLHEVVSFFAWVAEPMYRSSPGYRSVRMLVDRTTGEVLVGSVWDDEASLEEGFSRLEPIRDRAVEKGMKFVERTRREVIFYLAQ